MSRLPIWRAAGRRASERSGRSRRDWRRYGCSWAVVLDEGRQDPDAVIKLAGLRVEILCHPVDGRAAIGIGLRVDRLDQLAADTGAAHGRVSIEILQVADLFDA